MRRIVQLCLVLSFVATAACSGDDSPDFEPTPTPEPVTQDFPGTLTVNGAQTHQFQTDGGDLTATLTSLAPNTAATVGLAIGTWNGTSCQLVIAKTDAVQGTVLLATASQTGTLCVYIHDVGLLAASVSYVVTVVHP